MARNLEPVLQQNVRARIRGLGLTADQVAERAGFDEKGQLNVSARTVRNLVERGWPPNLTNLTLIAHALGSTVGSLLGEEASAGVDQRLAGLSTLASDLTDSDIEALTITARQLASARAAAMPARDDIPGWDQMTPQEQRAYEEAEALVRRMSRLRVAEPSAPYGAGAKRGSGGRAGGGRSPGGAARAQV